MIFTIEHGKDFFELNPEAKAVEEFSKCTSREMIYISLMYDYDSPFRRLPIADRKHKTALEAGYRTEPKRPNTLDKNARSLVNGSIPKVQKAAKKFNELQYDIERELLISTTEYIDDVNSILRKKDKDEGELQKCSRLIKEMSDTLKLRDSLIEKLEDRGAVVETEIEEEETGAEEISLLDKMNAKRFGQN